MSHAGGPAAGWRVVTVTDVAQLTAAAPLFDEPLDPAASAEFVSDERHHLLLAVDDGDVPVGFVSGVVLVHPDKGRELFLYELGVDPSARGRGVATSLVRALAELARELDCYGMWVLTDDDNRAAVGAYRRAGAGSGSVQRMLEWSWTERDAPPPPPSTPPGGPAD